MGTLNTAYIDILLEILRERLSVWDDPLRREAFYRMVRACAAQDDPVHQMPVFEDPADLIETDWILQFSKLDEHFMIRVAFRESGWAPEKFEAAQRDCLPPHQRIELYAEDEDGPEEILARAILSRPRDFAWQADRFAHAASSPEEQHTAEILRAFVRVSDGDFSALDDLRRFTDPKVARLAPSISVFAGPVKSAVSVFLSQPDYITHQIAQFIGRDGWEGSSWLVEIRDSLLTEEVSPDWTDGTPLMEHLYELAPSPQRADWLARDAYHREDWDAALKWTRESGACELDIVCHEVICLLEAGGDEAEARAMLDAILEPGDADGMDLVFDRLPIGYADFVDSLAAFSDEL